MTTQPSPRRPPCRLDCRGKTLDLGSRTHIMGILNTTPDSFSDGGRYLDPEAAVAHAQRLVEEGADILDIGGESTRPAGPYGAGAQRVPVEEELRRTVPVIERLALRLNCPISIDTTRAEVARRALDVGAGLVNDISAARFDPEMAPVVARSGAPIVLMHMQGTPQTMQKKPTYGDLMGEISAFLAQKRDEARSAGIRQVVLDPGLGFGKRYGHNFEILARLREFHALGCPLLVGPSRKGFVGAALRLPPQDRLEGTLAALVFCILGGAHIVRVHDVRAARRAIALAEDVIRFQN